LVIAQPTAVELGEDGAGAVCEDADVGADELVSEDVGEAFHAGLYVSLSVQ
jgi:hypothetical protein